ncbi:CAAX prenyl protease-related protein [Uliginosibacterium sp. H3]|uniref:CAAX prenyl protease-related protein n=1 Tax=Uliginosibacterium silvisoli TaxID=3114758 RepID=A0ABU6K585_9RHOO|nr:CAAX prenyl protease-related protein [Uliginosibacterium sp. H3]
MISALRLPRVERSVVARALPFSLYILCMALRGEAGALLGASLVQWLYPVQVALVAAVLWHFRAEYVELRAAPYSLENSPQVRAYRAALACALGIAVFVAWIHLDVSPLSIPAPHVAPPALADGSIDWRWIVLRIMGAALVVPLMEELFWRSLLMRWLEARDFLKVLPASVSWRSVLISSVVFGVEHNLWFAGIVAGIAYAWLYRQASLRAAIAAHALTNLLLGLWVVHTGQWQFW